MSLWNWNTPTPRCSNRKPSSCDASCARFLLPSRQISFSCCFLPDQTPPEETTMAGMPVKQVKYALTSTCFPRSNNVQNIQKLRIGSHQVHSRTQGKQTLSG